MPPSPTASQEAQPHVLVLAPQPFYEDRGTPIALMHVLSAMSRLGVLVDVVTFPVGAEVHLPGLRIFRAGPSFGIKRVPIGLSTTKLVFDVALTIRAWRQLRRQTYSAIYASEEAILPAILLGRRSGLPVIYDMQSSLPEQLMAHRLLRNSAVQSWLHGWERWFVRESTVIACSAGLEEHVLSIDESAIVEGWRYPGVVPSQSPAEIVQLRRDFEIPSDAPVIYYGGTFEHYQGINELLDAIPQVLARIPNAVFVLAGAPVDDAISLAAAAIPERSVRFLGRLARAKALACLALADVVVSARRVGRNLPLKIIDYMAAGKAIVATDHPAHRIALDETRACLVEPQSPAIAVGVLELLLDRSRAARLGAAARAFAEDVYGRHEFESQVSQILESACGRPLRTHRPPSEPDDE